VWKIWPHIIRTSLIYFIFLHTWYFDDIWYEYSSGSRTVHEFPLSVGQAMAWAPSTGQLSDRHLTLQGQNNSPGLRLWACSTLSVEVNFLQLLSPVRAQGRQYSPAGWGCPWERTGHTFSYQLAVLLAVEAVGDFTFWISLSLSLKTERKA